MEVLYNMFGVLVRVEWLARSSVPIAVRLQAVGNVDTPSELHIRAFAIDRDRGVLDSCQRDPSIFPRLFAPLVMRSWVIGDQDSRDHGVWGALYVTKFL